jgi:uncharacterized protein (DUF2267 family)
MEESAADKKTIESSLLGQISHLEEKLNQLEGENQICAEHNNELWTQIEAWKDSQEFLRWIVVGLLARAEELVFQKNLVKKEYSFLSSQMGYCSGEVVRLRQKVENMNDRMSLKSMKESVMGHERNLRDMSMSLTEIERDHFEQSDRVTGYSKIMKMRKCVIAVLAVNRFRKYSKGSFGKSLTSFGWFKDIDFSSDSHYTEISKKIRLISVPRDYLMKYGENTLSKNFPQDTSLSPAHLNHIDTISNFSLSNYDTVQMPNFSTFHPADPSIHLTSLVHLIIANQNALNKSRFRPHTLFDSLPSLLQSGLRPIRNFITSLPPALTSEYLQNCANPISPLDYDTQYLLFVFRSQSYMAKDISLLSSVVNDSQKRWAALQHEGGYLKSENSRLLSRLTSLEKELSKIPDYEQTINQLESTIENMVDKERYDELRSDMKKEVGQIYKEFDEIRKGREVLVEKVKEMEEREGEMQGIISQEKLEVEKLRRLVQEKEKDKEVVQVELESVRNIMQQKEGRMKDVENELREEVERVRDWQDVIRKLSGERERMHQDNRLLQEEVGRLKSSLDELRMFIDEQKIMYESEREKDQDYIKFLKNFNTGESAHKKGWDIQNTNSKDTHNRTANFNHSASKENISLNSINNIPSHFSTFDPLAYGKITKNRTKSVTRM